MQVFECPPKRPEEKPHTASPSDFLLTLFVLRLFGERDADDGGWQQTAARSLGPPRKTLSRVLAALPTEWMILEQQLPLHLVPRHLQFKHGPRC